MRGLRAHVPHDSVLRRQWRAARYRRLQHRLAGRRLLQAFADAYPDAFFIEIGANDGEQSDHLRPFILSRRWSGIMVEPVPYIFERLQRTYGGTERLVLANLAIADRDGALPFYYAAAPDDAERESLPSWYEGIGSLSRDAVLRHLRDIPDLEDRLVGQVVPCLTFESLCREYDVERVDLVLSDTEGFDAQIVRGIDLSRHHPRLLIYEHYHLPPDERAACRAHVERCDYATMEEGFDTFCLDVSVDDRLTRAWRQLRPAVPGVSTHDPAHIA
jgi:FkbM family methyltransferase